MKGSKGLTVLLVVSSVLALANCSSSRNVTATVPSVNPAPGLASIPSGGVHVRTIPSSCNYESTTLPISCVAAPSDGTAPIVSEADATTLQCSLALDNNMTYQLFLDQNGVHCAELHLNQNGFTPDQPTIIGKDDADFDLGDLIVFQGALVPTNNPEDVMDTDGDGTLDAADPDVDGNGISDVLEDADGDLLANGLDVNDDSDVNDCFDGQDETSICNAL